MSARDIAANWLFGAEIAGFAKLRVTTRQQGMWRTYKVTGLACAEMPAAAYTKEGKRQAGLQR